VEDELAGLVGLYADLGLTSIARGPPGRQPDHPRAGQGLAATVVGLMDALPHQARTRWRGVLSRPAAAQSSRLGPRPQPVDLGSQSPLRHTPQVDQKGD